MRTIVITAPDLVINESERIAALLESGCVWRVHIRKPQWDEKAIRQLIESIPKVFYPCLSLHDWHWLAVDYGLGGIHLNSRNPMPPAGFSGLVSRSCHSLDELSASNADYNFLSPIFDSISKTGYHSGFSIGELHDAADRGVIGQNTFALGGIEPKHLSLLHKVGFGGATMLGAVWNQTHKGAFIHTLLKLMQNFSLQLITDGAGVDAAIAGGCRWVQLRMKDAANNDILRVGKHIGELCRSAGATFIIDDHVELVKPLSADGVHLGKTDMPADEARKIIGYDKIIGVTANSYKDIINATSLGADYIGLGPFRFTTTKKNLSPVLGLDGYRNIMARCHAEGISLPIVAIGGITACDVAGIMATGISGIAVSGAILNASNITEETKNIISNISWNI